MCGYKIRIDEMRRYIREHFFISDCVKTKVMELLDRATPYTPARYFRNKSIHFRCKCGFDVIPAVNYCENCGQAIDWSAYLDNKRKE